MKRCFKCGRRKAIDEFYRHPKMADGHLGKCKSCTKADVRRHRVEHSEKVRAYDRWRERAHPGRKKKTRKRARAWAQKHPQKRRAEQQANRALKAGRLLKGPCVECGDEKSEMHHEDYMRPLDVVWLCHLHHMRRHGAARRTF